MAESYLDLIRRLENDPTFGPAMLADQPLALACYDQAHLARRGVAAHEHTPRQAGDPQLLAFSGRWIRQPAAAARARELISVG